MLIPQWLPTAIVYAPNFRKELASSGDPTLKQLVQLGVSRQLRLDVGPPNASLAVWIMEPPASTQGPCGTVLVLHGIRDQKDSMRGIGRMLAEAGYRAVLVDLRGHGRSTGDWLTYGVVDSNDLKQVLNHLDAVKMLDTSVGVLGCSYRGAVALQLAALDARVKTVVTVATFTSLNDAVTSSERQFAPEWMITQTMIVKGVDEAGTTGKFQASQANPLLAITRTQAKVLLIHRTEDRKLPCSFSQALLFAA